MEAFQKIHWCDATAVAEWQAGCYFMTPWWQVCWFPHKLRHSEAVITAFSRFMTVFERPLYFTTSLCIADPEAWWCCCFFPYLISNESSERGWQQYASPWCSPENQGCWPAITRCPVTCSALPECPRTCIPNMQDGKDKSTPIHTHARMRARTHTHTHIHTYTQSAELCTGHPLTKQS